MVKCITRFFLYNFYICFATRQSFRSKPSPEVIGLPSVSSTPLPHQEASLIGERERPLARLLPSSSRDATTEEEEIVTGPLSEIYDCKMALTINDVLDGDPSLEEGPPIRWMPSLNASDEAEFQQRLRTAGQYIPPSAADLSDLSPGTEILGGISEGFLRISTLNSSSMWPLPGAGFRCMGIYYAISSSFLMTLSLLGPTVMPS